MNTYQIQLQTQNTVRLIKDTNFRAAKPFDGGHIFYSPESYPARIIDTYTGEQVDVANADAFGVVRGMYIRAGKLTA